MRAGENFGQSIGNGIKSFLEQRKKDADDTKRARSMLKLMGDESGLDPAAIENMSGPQAHGALDALTFKKSSLAQQTLNALHQSETARQQLEAEKMKRDMLDTATRQAQAPGFWGEVASRTAEQPPTGAELDTNLGQFMDNPSTAPPANRPGSTVPQAMMEAGQRYPAMLTDRDTAAMLHQSMTRGNAAGPMNFEEDPSTGSRFARVGNSVLPSGINPLKQPHSAVPQYDEQDNLLGHSIPNGKGGYIFKPLKNVSAELTPAQVNGKAVPGIFVTSDGKTLDLRDELTKKIGGEAAPAADAPKGKLYFWKSDGKLHDKPE